MDKEIKDKILTQVQEIFKWVLEGNGFEARKKETTGNLPTFFLWYSGHVNTLEINIYNDGWEPGKFADKNYFLSLDKIIPDDTLINIKKDIDKAAKTAEISNIIREIEKCEEEADELREMLKRINKMTQKRISEVG